MKTKELGDHSLGIDDARKRKSKAKENTYHRVHRGKKDGGRGEGWDGLGANSERKAQLNWKMCGKQRTYRRVFWMCGKERTYGRDFCKCGRERSYGIFRSGRGGGAMP